MATTLYDLEKDLPHLEGSLAEYGSSSLENIKHLHKDRLLASIIGFSQSDTIKDMKPISVAIRDFLDQKDRWIAILKSFREYDFYTLHASEITAKKEQFIAYHSIITDILAKNFIDQEIGTNPTYAMFIQKEKLLDYAIQTMTVLEAYGKRNDYDTLAAAVLTIQENVAALQDIKQHILVMGFPADEPVIAQIDELVEMAKKLPDNHTKLLQKYYDTEMSVEGGLVGYSLPSSSLPGEMRDIHQLLGLNNPSGDVKKIAVLQDTLLGSTHTPTKIKTFQDIQTLFLEIYYKLCCIYTSKNISGDIADKQLSPQYPIYQQLTAITDILQNQYNEAQKLGGDLSQKTGLSHVLTSSKTEKLKNIIRTTIKKYFSQYKKLHVLVAAHNTGTRWENEKTLEQLMWLGDWSQYAHQSFSVNKLNPTIEAYFEKYMSQD